MSDIYEEYGLELEAEYTPEESFSAPESTNTPKKGKGGGWGKAIIAFFLGFVIALGALGGGGYALLSQPAGPTLEWIGEIADFNYATEVRNKYLSEEWENDTFLDILKELYKVVEDKNLASLSKIVPEVGNYVEKMVNEMNANFGVKMDSTTILTKKWMNCPTT